MTDGLYRVEDPGAGDQARIAARVITQLPAQFHVPEAPHRPGDEPRFARFPQQPTDLPRPHVLARYEELREHAVGLVRVLDDDSVALGPWNPQLPPATVRKGLEWMVRTRAFDSRLLNMQRQGRLGFYVESKGEEAGSVAAGMVFRPEDMLFPAYRQQGMLLARGMPPVEMMCQCIGNQRDFCKGRQMQAHYTWKQGNVVSISSPVGTQFPQAVGAAMATAYRGEHSVTSAWIGEGTTSQGDFHYALNFASVYLPPVVLNVVNNQWAISTHRNLATGGKTFACRAESYGLPGIRVDGNDFLAVHAVTHWAAERARKEGGPTLIELLTYRTGAHTSSDDPTCYRPNDEGRLWPGGDPIARLSKHLMHLGEWSETQQQELETTAEKEMAAIFKEAEKIGSASAGPFDPPTAIVDDVYEQMPWHLKRQQDALKEN